MALSALCILNYSPCNDLGGSFVPGGVKNRLFLPVALFFPLPSSCLVPIRDSLLLVATVKPIFMLISSSVKVSGSRKAEAARVPSWELDEK